MRSIIWLMLLCAVGCNQEPSAAIKARAAELSSGFRKHAEAISAKQDESLSLLTQVNSRVGDLLLASDDTKQRLESLEASLVKSEPQPLGGDPAAHEPQEIQRANQSQPSIPVALSPAVRSSGPLKLSWNVEGNWNPSILETARHLREDHGIIADGMSHQEMHDTHAAVHEGRQVAMKQQPVQMMQRGSSCPGGVCPTPRTVRYRSRR